MAYVILTYNHRDGRVSTWTHDAHDAALTELRVRERAAQPHEEIVLFCSDSVDTLRRTHARYFHTIEEIAGAGANRLSAAEATSSSQIEALRTPRSLTQTDAYGRMIRFGPLSQTLQHRLRGIDEPERDPARLAWVDQVDHIELVRGLER